MRWRDVVALAVILGVLLAPNLLGPLTFYDSGLSSSAGTFMLHGKLPYRDFWWLYGPGSGILMAVPSALFGPSILVSRLVGLLTMTLLGAVGYALLRAKVPHVPASLIALGSVAPVVVVSQLDVSAWPVSLVLALAAIYCRIGTSLSPAWSGLLVGLAFGVRLDVGGYALLALLLLPDRRVLLTGATVVALPLVLFALLTTPFADLVEQLVWYPLVGVREFRAVPSPNYTDPVSALIVLPLVIVPKAAIVASVLWLFFTKERRSIFLPLTLFAALCQLQTLGRADIEHQAQAATAGFLLLGIWASDPMGQFNPRAWNPARRWLQSIGRAATLVLCALAVAAGSLGFARAQLGPLPPLDAGFFAGVRTLIANTAPTEPIYVGLTSHRYTVVNPMLAYYLADRSAGVRTAMFNPGITNTDPGQRRMVEDLVASGTELLLLDDSSSSTFEATNASRSPGSTVLDEFIAREFVLACDFGAMRVMASRDRTRPVTCVPPSNERLADVLSGLAPVR